MLVNWRDGFQGRLIPFNPFSCERIRFSHTKPPDQTLTLVRLLRIRSECDGSFEITELDECDWAHGIRRAVVLDGALMCASLLRLACRPVRRVSRAD